MQPGRLVAYTTLAGATVLPAVPAIAGVSGGGGVVSKYIWAGVVMSEDPAIQGNLAYRHRPGFHAGVWASSLTKAASDNNQLNLTIGYNGTRGSLGWDIGFLYHRFTGSGATDNDANAPRAYGRLSYESLTVIAKPALDDASWVAQGDIYISIGLTQSLPGGFTASARAGFYRFAGDAVLDDGTVVTPKEQKLAFRDADLALSRGLGTTGLDVSIHYTIGGELRDGEGLGNHLWAGLSWSLN